MGRSLGSASACEIIDNYSNNIDGCIIESGFATEYSLLALMNINPDIMTEFQYLNKRTNFFYNMPVNVLLNYAKHKGYAHDIPIQNLVK